MIIDSRRLLKSSSLIALTACAKTLNTVQDVFLGQGTIVGEVTSSSALLQTRITATAALDADGDMHGANGIVSFEWSKNSDFSGSSRATPEIAAPENDFIVRSLIGPLEANTQYYFRAIYGNSLSSTLVGPTGKFSTLAGKTIEKTVQFIVGSCMNYTTFMHGKEGKASGPVTATEEDKNTGYPSFRSMLEKEPDFFVGTGDIVYYDNKLRHAETLAGLRKTWHEQFRFPRLQEFFRSVPTYWSKDDHDFRYNDADLVSDRFPSPKVGIDLFREQLPLSPRNKETPSYRTHRISQDLQIWLTEGRDYRSNNLAPDNAEKSMWGSTQLAWLKDTLLESDATWRILISPTPMVGPDDLYKKDSHANVGGFQHEGEEFFNWLKESRIQNFAIVCGDRHWQYHSVHQSGVHEFGCGALNDENARLGVAPGDKNGSDSEGLIEQKFSSPTPTGGFLAIQASTDLVFEHFNSAGELQYHFQLPST